MVRQLGLAQAAFLSRSDFFAHSRMMAEKDMDTRPLALTEIVPR
jgi:hypothetical protein